MDGYYELQRDTRNRISVWNRTKMEFDSHFHGAIELTYITRGELRGFCNGEEYGAKAGELLIFPSYSIHSGVTSEDFRGLVLLIPLDYSSSVFSALNGKDFNRILLTDPAACEEICHCMKMVRQKKTTKVHPLTTRGYINASVGTLIDKVGIHDIDTDKNKHLAKDILIYLQENFLLPVSLEEIATKFGYSKYSFSHLFNSYFRCSMTDYINSMRARYAANQLMETEDSMIEVAMNSGFESLRTFYRAFKKYYNKTPSEYKKTLKR